MLYITNIFKFLRFLFYRILNIISSNNFPLDAGDFRLCDKEVIKEILKVNHVDYYYSNVIARASKTMFECKNSKINFKLTGTEG